MNSANSCAEDIISKNGFKELKFAHKIIGCNLQKHFQDTVNYNSNMKNNLIKDIEIKEQQLHQRIFYKKNNKKIGYIEVFQNPSLSYAHQISEKITFLFENYDKNNEKIDPNKCFGFRFYDNKNNFCTLLKSDDQDEDNYYFLEKLEKEDNEFYNKEIDCFKIIFDALFSRYIIKNNEDEIKFDFPLIIERPIYEILGFSYAVMFKSNEKFKFHKIHSIDAISDVDFTSYIEKENDDTKLNVIPILFDGHISTLFFTDYNNKRDFKLSDPGHIHSKNYGNSISINPFMFTENMHRNLSILPNHKLQSFNSCSLWYYCQILCLLNYNEKIQTKKYNDAKDFEDSLNNSNFYYDCFNYYQYLMKFNKKLIIINPPELFDDHDYFYVLSNKKYLTDNIKIHKFCFLNQFVDFIELIYLKTGQYLTYKPGINEMKTFREQNEELLDFIIFLNYNLNFLELKANKDTSVIQILGNYLEEINDIRQKFVVTAIRYLSALAQIDVSTKTLEFYDSAVAKKKKINGKYLYEILSEAEEIMKDFREIKDKIEVEFNLYSLNITNKILFPIVGVLYKSK